MNTEQTLRLAKLAFDTYISRGYPIEICYDDIVSRDIPIIKDLFWNETKRLTKEHQEVSRKSIQRFKKHLGTKV